MLDTLLDLGPGAQPILRSMTSPANLHHRPGYFLHNSAKMTLLAAIVAHHLRKQEKVLIATD